MNLSRTSPASSADVYQKTSLHSVLSSQVAVSLRCENRVSSHKLSCLLKTHESESILGCACESYKGFCTGESCEERSDDLLETIKTVNISLIPQGAQDVLVKGSYLIRTDDGGYSLSLRILTQINPVWIWKTKNAVLHTNKRSGQTHTLHLNMDFVAILGSLLVIWFGLHMFFQVYV